MSCRHVPLELGLVKGEIIDHREIKLRSRIGRGGYGTIYKAEWRGRDVAVKFFQCCDAEKSLRIEIGQLSRLEHENIIQFYGVCINQYGPMCLVTEYADCGSLFYLLHTWKTIQYQRANALHWALQCARGVAYLHGLKPKPVVHRDLKTPNLLLCNLGTQLKICDFGTACDLQTIMTNNKGSAAWMAPEVFEGCNYDEKCDVYSWGIILWEVLARRIPFEEMVNSTYQIMWAVHNRQRPPDVPNCPAVVDSLMKRCWDGDPLLRPSMEEARMVLEDFLTTNAVVSVPLNLDMERPDTPEAAVSEDFPLQSRAVGLNVDVSDEASGVTVQPPTIRSTINLYADLDHDLQPILPLYELPESVAIYEEHVSLCERLLGLRKQLEIIKNEKDLLGFFPGEIGNGAITDAINQHAWHLFEEKRSLVAMKRNFLEQIAQLEDSAGD